ncbi:MAG: FecR family protein [Saprospiraceae bacterium]
MEETLYTDLIAKYLSGNMSATERESLWTWIEADTENRQFFDQMVQLWGMSGDYEEAAYPADTAQAWSKLEGRLFGGAVATATEVPQPSNKIVRLSIKRAWMAAAAVILLTISVGIWLYQNPFSTGNQVIVYETKAQERRMIELPDHSKVWLNENTRLSFDTVFTERVVILEGEAFFDVEHLDGKPFTIVSGEAETRVLGTTFNVRAYPSEAKVEVTVETGKVALQDKKNTQKKVLLEAGKSGFFDKQTQEVKEVEQAISNADAWKTQRLDFDDTPIEEVVQALERYFDIEMTIENEAIMNCRYSITQPYDTPSLPEVIDGLEFVLNLQIEKQDSVYIIRGEGCK